MLTKKNSFIKRDWICKNLRIKQQTAGVYRNYHNINFEYDQEALKLFKFITKIFIIRKVLVDLQLSEAPNDLFGLVGDGVVVLVSISSANDSGIVQDLHVVEGEQRSSTRLKFLLE
jgi:hypothetical protein